MPFLRKLLYYMIGVGMGVLVVMFMFGDRDFGCSYFPNDRVLSDLRKKELVIPSDVQSQMSSARLDTSDIRIMLERGEVDFDKIDRGLDSCKTYWVALKRKQKRSFSAQWQNCDSVATLLELKL